MDDDDNNDNDVATGLRLHQIRENHRLRVYGRILEDLRLPPERLPLLRQLFERLDRQLICEIRVQVGTIMADRFEFESLDAHVQEFAVQIGALVNAVRGTEGLQDARRSACAVLSAALSGAIGSGDDAGSQDR